MLNTTLASCPRLNQSAISIGRRTVGLQGLPVFLPGFFSNFPSMRSTSISAWSWPSLRPSADSVTSVRSEEQTSELQSLMRLSYAVFRLNKNIHKHPKQYRYSTHTQHRYN